MIKASQISTIINEIYDGVERSRVGKIISDCEVSDKFPDGKKINHIPLQTYLEFLRNSLPKNIVQDLNINEEEK